MLTGESRNRVSIFWNQALAGNRGTYGYYSVRSNGVAPRQGLITEGDIHTTNIGLFAQDAWTINNKLTVNVGVRTERERVPTYTSGSGIPDYGIEFNFSDKLAPRAGFEPLLAIRARKPRDRRGVLRPRARSAAKKDRRQEKPDHRQKSAR